MLCCIFLFLIYYQLLASGIVCETIATGRPIILPQKNHPAYLVEKNCGAFFQWNDRESLKFSLENFIKNYQHFNEKSIIASRDWHKSEGIKKFCKFIVKINLKKKFYVNQSSMDFEILSFD